MSATQIHDSMKLSLPSTNDDQDPYVGVACWMREMGTRSKMSMESTLPPVSKTRYIVTTPSFARWRILREGLLLAALVAAYLQYHLIGNLVQIALIHSIIVFVFPFPV